MQSISLTKFCFIAIKNISYPLARENHDKLLVAPLHFISMKFEILKHDSYKTFGAIVEEGSLSLSLCSKSLFCDSFTQVA